MRWGWEAGEIGLGEGKAADLVGEGFGGSPLGLRFFPPRFALRVVKERLEKSAEAPQFCLLHLPQGLHLSRR